MDKERKTAEESILAGAELLGQTEAETYELLGAGLIPSAVFRDTTEYGRAGTPYPVEDSFGDFREWMAEHDHSVSFGSLDEDFGVYITESDAEFGIAFPFASSGHVVSVVRACPVPD